MQEGARTMHTVTLYRRWLTDANGQPDAQTILPALEPAPGRIHTSADPILCSRIPTVHVLLVFVGETILTIESVYRAVFTILGRRWATTCLW